jgi:hypothetical protein
MHTILARVSRLAMEEGEEADEVQHLPFR